MGYTVVGSRKTRGFRVLWAMEELGLAYDHIPALPASDEIRAVSPIGKVPALKDGDDVICDSVAIMTYLADKHGGLTHPAGTIERARQDAWTNRIIDELDALLWTAARHSFILPKDQRVPEVKDSLKAEFDRNIQRLASEIDGPFMAGDFLTIPDILLMHCGSWALFAKFPPLPDKIKANAKVLMQRPAYQKAAALP